MQMQGKMWCFVFFLILNVFLDSTRLEVTLWLLKLNKNHGQLQLIYGFASYGANIYLF